MGLQFSWIEANLLGFFLVDVRNSRGKFYEIKEKFVINPAPTASQSSLNAGGTRWTRDLPRNSFNFFTSRSKVEEQRREIHAFKEGNWARNRGHWKRSWALFEGVVGAVPWGKDAASIPQLFWPNSAVDLAPISTILAPRSGFNRGPRFPPISIESGKSDSAAENMRSRLDRGSIGPRSWGSSPFCLRRPIVINRWLDDHD